MHKVWTDYLLLFLLGFEKRWATGAQRPAEEKAQRMEEREPMGETQSPRRQARRERQWEFHVTRCSCGQQGPL